MLAWRAAKLSRSVVGTKIVSLGGSRGDCKEDQDRLVKPLAYVQLRPA